MLELIAQDKEEIFSEIIKKRNLTVHTYNEELANEIHDFIKGEVVNVFEDIKQQIKQYIYADP